MPLSKNKIKYIRSLEQKKVRKEEKVFLAEGPKLIDELIDTFSCEFLAATPEWLADHPSARANEVVAVTQSELSRASLLKTPQQVLAVFKQPESVIDINLVRSTLSLALDDIQDPGNLGTIIRLADWFGIENIFCSQNTVDVYSPKTIQATMGGIARVHVHYLPLDNFIRSLENIPVYGTFLEGENIYNSSLTANGVIVMGNEGKGITPETERVINKKLYVPSFPQDRETSESLNVAIATAIVCAEFRRRNS